MDNRKNIIPRIGVTFPRQDACSKVMGREKFSSDFYSSDMLYAGVKRAGIPHGRIRNISTESALSTEGVIAVLTFKDITGSNRQGVIRKDQPVLADDRVRHCGDAVALVIAESPESLKQGIDSVTVDYEPLEAIFSTERALEDGAVIIHDDNPTGNLLLKGSLERGNITRGFEECNHIVKGSFYVPMQEHAYLETEAGWAIMKDDGRVYITAATQTPFRDRMEIAHATGIEMERVAIKAPFCGGAFGGKDGISVQSLLCLAALKCPGRPVKMWWSREESFLASPKRHSAMLEYRLGAKSDGTLHALEAEITYDTGPYDHLGGAVMALGLEHAGGPYRISNTSLKTRAVYTNNPLGGAFRAFGVAQVAAAVEQMIDMLSTDTGISPLKIREINCVRKGDINSAGMTIVTSTGISDCLERIKSDPMYRQSKTWKSNASLFKKRGVGLAAVMQGMGYGPVVPDVAHAKIELLKDGIIRIYSGVTDMGQGNSSTYVQIAGEMLNQGAEQFELLQPDTDKSLPSGSATASRTTYTFGNALIGACEIFRERLLVRAADMLMVTGQEMAILPGRVRHLPSGRELGLAQLASFLSDSERCVSHRFRMPVSEDRPTGDEMLRLHGIPHAIFSYAAHLAFVEVDLLTGGVEVLKYLAVTDCGRIINPQLYEQQIQGGISQAMGYALSEEFLSNEGVVRSADFSTYIIPTSLDIPDMVSLPVEIPESTGPLGLKGVGEISTNGPLPAIANAVYDAVGERIFQSPLTSERVLTAIESSKRNGDA
ncbi:MAG: xanthine dehydrogenase family protein [Desulfatiglans sp.]|nr:xanthine dehydrogenase family protein [Desulfatiglans sp.]